MHHDCSKSRNNSNDKFDIPPCNVHIFPFENHYLHLVSSALGSLSTIQFCIRRRVVGAYVSMVPAESYKVLWFDSFYCAEFQLRRIHLLLFCSNLWRWEPLVSCCRYVKYLRAIKKIFIIFEILTLSMNAVISAKKILLLAQSPQEYWFYYCVLSIRTTL